MTSPLRAQWSGQDSLIIARAEFSPPPDSIFLVDKVMIRGNEKTKDYVVFREMEIREGSYITREALDHDLSRIYNLGLFNRVQIGYIPHDPSAATLLILVEERWYFFPFPVVGIKDRDWKKLYYGAGLIHSNFRGRNEKLYAVFLFGYDPAVILSYRNPMIDEKQNHFLDAGLSWRVVRNKSTSNIMNGENFDERHFGSSLGFGRRFGVATTLWASAGIEYVKVSEYHPGRSISSDGVDVYPTISLGYSYETRDVEEYAMSGTFIRATLVKSGIPGKELDFVRYAGDARRYIPLLPKFTLATRLFGDFVAAGATPSYTRVYLGYDQRVRGHFSEIYEGENQLGASAELRIMLLTPRFVKMGFIPMPEFALWKFGVALAFFGEAGTVWFRGQAVSWDSFIRGYGAGLHFLLPYGFVLRTEFGFRNLQQSEFILDFTTAF